MPLDNPPASRLETRLKHEIKGDVLFDPFTRGRYSTDASIYQIEPLGVVVARGKDDIAASIQIAREEGVPVLPRGGGTSQCGQTVNRALVVECSKYMQGVGEVDTAAKRVKVQPGVVMERLNARLRQHKLWFPVDVSTGDRATIGGMTANNSCGARSIRYGNMVHNVRAIDALLADGTQAHFGEVPSNLGEDVQPDRYRNLVSDMRDLYGREAEEIDARIPKLLRKVGGYNIDMLKPKGPDSGHNMANLLVGSEGTLAFFTEIELDLQPIPPHRVLGICHFPTFYKAMESTQHIVKLGPAAVELVDRTMIELARDIPMFRATVDRFVQGEPEAILLTEFAGPDPDDNNRRLKQLVELMGDLGFPGAVIEATDPAFQSAVWNVRKEGLNIMMSMKGDGKPVSFIEDCAVRLEDLAEYTDRLTQVFHKHGTNGTWYAHASVGTLHVRPVINLKQDLGAKQMREIAEEAFAMVREYKGSHSGEHGDGIVRSEFLEPMYGARIVRAFEEVKDKFDPDGVFNPGKIVRPPKMDDRTLMRFKPGYTQVPLETAFDWSEWGGFASAAEMCNNNGACRKSDPGVMCPSYRATGDEQHLTRGRANTLRLALSGQLGPDALTSDAMAETMSLCVSCKGCRRECPTGVDMAKMKLEFLVQYRKRHKLTLRDKLIAYLPRYAPWASRFAGLLNLRTPGSFLARLGEKLVGFSAKRPLPCWSSRPYRGTRSSGEGYEVVLLVDTFNRYFEPENAEAAERVLTRAGYNVTMPDPNVGRPLCCGRTFLAAGLVDEAKAEARRMIAALEDAVAAGTPIIGLEPSCLLTLRDEYPALLGEVAKPLAAHAQLFEEFVESECKAGRFNLMLKAMPGQTALLHGHCHQKAFGTAGAAADALKLIPQLTVETFDSTCCGMAGAFGYEAEHHEMSLTIGELGVLPKMRAAPEGTLLAACGTSCRHQIADGAQRRARHIVCILDGASAEL
ncbi:MAG TPA: FAD-linked oxidase C-terminal domain-containing protein [Stellaceae bacterium]|jgi:FAD/FMN-containing dehydrogenase/Fe-S oxidoreductase|nr:FAD-linked oxidase C-terminal domain-containing protein [Stellaceae bacterium]